MLPAINSGTSEKFRMLSPCTGILHLSVSLFLIKTFGWPQSTPAEPPLMTEMSQSHSQPTTPANSALKLLSDHLNHCILARKWGLLYNFSIWWSTHHCRTKGSLWWTVVFFHQVWQLLQSFCNLLISSLFLPTAEKSLHSHQQLRMIFQNKSSYLLDNYQAESEWVIQQWFSKWFTDGSKRLFFSLKCGNLLNYCWTWTQVRNARGKQLSIWWNWLYPWPCENYHVLFENWLSCST